MHRRRMNLSSLVRTTVYLCADCTDSAATASLYGSLLRSAHPCSQALQPIQSVASYKMALLIFFSNTNHQLGGGQSACRPKPRDWKAMRRPSASLPMTYESAEFSDSAYQRSAEKLSAVHAR